MSSLEKIDDANAEFVMPKNSHRIDIPLPTKNQVYLNWALDGSDLYLQFRQEACDQEPSSTNPSENKDKDSNDDKLITQGILSPKNSTLAIELDFTMPNPIPHITIKNGLITLLHNGIKPTGLTLHGEFDISHGEANFGPFDYTFNW